MVSAFAVQNHILVSGARGGEIKAWDLLTGTCFLTFNHKDTPKKIVIEGNIVAVLSCCKISVKYLHNNINFEFISTRSNYSALDLKNNVLLIGCRDGIVTIRNVHLPEKMSYFNVLRHSTPKGKGLGFVINYTAFIFDNILVTCEEEYIIRYWDINTKKCLYSFQYTSGFTRGPSTVDYSRICHVNQDPKIVSVIIKDQKMVIGLENSSSGEGNIEVWKLPEELTQSII